MRIFVRGASLCLSFLSIGVAIHAQAQEAAANGGGQTNGWRVDLGVSALAYPLYPGSRIERVLPIPAIEVHYDDSFFASVREGVGYNLLRWHGFEAGPVANFAFPRNESDKRAALHGLGDVPFTIEAGGFIRYNAGDFATAKIEARQGLNGHNGLVVDTSLDLNAPPVANNRIFLSAGPRFSYYDHSYAQAFFGVTPLQSLQSGYAPFRADYADKVSIGGAAVYLITNRITWTIFGDYGRYIGGVINSPILRSRYGTPNQYTVGSALTYRFNIGG